MNFKPYYLLEFSMKNVFGNMLDHRPSAMVITTNGYVTLGGRCVMGAGIAKQMSNKFPDLAYTLGSLIRTNGNIVQVIGTYDDIELIAFPVKPVHVLYTKPEDVVKHQRDKFKLNTFVMGWAATAQPELIEKSCKQLQELILEHPEWKHILCPRFGCGAGELNWNDIEPIAQKYLDDTVYCMTFKTH